MQRSVISFVVAAVLGCMPGCGDDTGNDNPFADAGPQPDARPDARPPAADAAPGDATPVADAPMNMEGPAVEVLSPDAPPAGNFTSAEIVVTDRFTARCRVTENAQTGDGVDTSTVRITVFGTGGAMQEAFAQPTTVQDEYSASLSVVGFPNGSLSVRCTASDLAASPRVNSDEIQTYLDLGPQVLVFSPVASSSFANAVEVVFRVSASPVATGDTGATPNFAGITASLAGVDISADLVENPIGSGVYRATLNFEDSRFVPSLDGPQTLTIRAPNTRTSTPVTRTARVVFVADSDGPTIVIDSPLPGEFIARIFTLTATITDNAGVDPTSVIATIAGTHDFTLSSTGGDGYAGSFDTRALPNTMVFPTVVVRARDSVGNQSSVGEVLTLDNRAPVASLDPPPMRESFFDSNEQNIKCSHKFDPVGADAADDGESIAQLSELRARVEDLGNGATTGNNGIVIPKAGVDMARVQLFVLDDTSRALIVDTNGDGVCDDIDPTLVPTSIPMAANEAAVINLAGLPADGAVRFTSPVAPPFSGAAEASCFEDLDDTSVPAPICDISSPATRITKEQIGTDPVIFSIAPQTEIQCLGNAFDAAATNISDGWACVAVRALDALGNVGISPPLRVCIDGDGNMAECAAWGTIATIGLPDCTGTYSAATNTTNPAVDCTMPTSFVDLPGLQVRRNDL
jgi:hypothetical protein